MPTVLIEVAKKYTNEKEISLIEAVRSALKDSFKILINDINVRLVVHEHHRFSAQTSAQPALYTHPELFTLISIDVIAGRSTDTKRNLYRSIVTNLESLGIPKDHVKILLRETTKEDWGIRGGQAACDLELGYKIEI